MIQVSAEQDSHPKIHAQVQSAQVQGPSSRTWFPGTFLPATMPLSRETNFQAAASVAVLTPSREYDQLLQDAGA